MQKKSFDVDYSPAVSPPLKFRIKSDLEQKKAFQPIYIHLYSTNVTLHKRAVLNSTNREDNTMPRPKTKVELQNLSRENYSKLIKYIDTFTDNEKYAEFPEGTMNRNIRDVLAHLHEWHLMFLEWYEIGMQNEKPDMPAPGYTWRELPKLNKKIWEDYNDADLDKIRELLNESYSEIQKIIERHTNKELFEKKRYKWTGSTSLGAYLVSATSSHYDWAYNLIRKAKKTSPFVT